MRYFFSSIKLTAKRLGTRSKCGKRCTCSKTFERTVNPFNRNADGQEKTHAEVQADNREDAKRWATLCVCKGCEVAKP